MSEFDRYQDEQYRRSKSDREVASAGSGCLMGGMGSAILEFMADNKYKSDVVRIGIPDKYIHHGTQDELHAECGYDKAGIITTVKQVVNFQEKDQSEIKNNVG